MCEKCFDNYEEYQDFCKQEDEIFENEIKTHTNSSRAVAIDIDKSRGIINIYAYVNIQRFSPDKGNIVDDLIEGSNITYRQAVLNGIRNGWTGHYIDENGVSNLVIVHILDLGDHKKHNVRDNQNVININLSPSSEPYQYNEDKPPSKAWTNWEYEYYNKAIGLMCGDTSLLDLQFVSAHEFGHVLGLDDVYLLPVNEQFYSVMCDQTDSKVMGNALQVDYAMMLMHKTYLYNDVTKYSRNIVKEYAHKYNEEEK